jgi:hypothetical protein
MALYVVVVVEILLEAYKVIGLDHSTPTLTIYLQRGSNRPLKL